LQKSLLVLMYFTYNIYTDKRFHIGKEVLSHKKPYLQPWMKCNEKRLWARTTWIHANFSSRQINIKIWVWGKGGGGRVFYDLLGRSILCNPRTLSLYHSMFWCNFPTLAILDVCLCNMCAKKKKPTKKAYTFWVKCDLAWYKPDLF